MSGLLDDNMPHIASQPDWCRVTSTAETKKVSLAGRGEWVGGQVFLDVADFNARMERSGAVEANLGAALEVTLDQGAPAGQDSVIRRTLFDP